MTTTTRRRQRLTRSVLAALAACSLLAALAAPAAAGPTIGVGGSEGNALPADPVSLNKATPILFGATGGAVADAPAEPETAPVPAAVQTVREAAG
jgi:hypothetical protein